MRVLVPLLDISEQRMQSLRPDLPHEDVARWINPLDEEAVDYVNKMITNLGKEDPYQKITPGIVVEMIDVEMGNHNLDTERYAELFAVGENINTLPDLLEVRELELTTDGLVVDSIIIDE